MGLVDRLKNKVLPTLPADPDDVEWDAHDHGGNEAAYDGLATRTVTYNPALFATETEDDGEVVKVAKD